MHAQTPDEQALICLIRNLSAPIAPVPTGVSTASGRLDGVRAVVFDMYGTLFVSGSGDIALTVASPGAFDDALVESGFRGLMTDSTALGLAFFADAIQREHQTLKAAGIDYPEVDIRKIWHACLTTMKASGRLAGEITQNSVMRLAVGYECRVNPTWPMPGMAGILSRLRAAGLSLGIVSNAQFYSPLLFDALVGRSPDELGFESALTSWSYQEREAKPSARLFSALIHKAKHCLGLRPSELLYVGNDMLNDILPARAAGLQTALFAGDRRSLRMRENHPECRTIAPDRMLGELADLVHFLGLGLEQPISGRD